MVQKHAKAGIFIMFQKLQWRSEMHRTMNIKTKVVIPRSNSGWRGSAVVRELREEDFWASPSKCVPQVSLQEGLYSVPAHQYPATEMACDLKQIGHKKCMWLVCVRLCKCPVCGRRHGLCRYLEVLLPTWLPTQRGGVLFWVTISLWNCGTVPMYYSHSRSQPGFQFI